MTDGNDSRIRSGRPSTLAAETPVTPRVPTPLSPAAKAAATDTVVRQPTSKLAKKLDAERSVTSPTPQLVPPGAGTTAQKLKDFNRRLDGYPYLFKHSELITENPCNKAEPRIDTARMLRILAVMGPELRSVAMDKKQKPAMLEIFETRIGARNPEVPPAEVKRLAGAVYHDVLLLLPQSPDSELIRNERTLLGLSVQAMAEELAALPAFQGLSERSRKDFLRLTGGPLGRLSNRARRDLVEFMATDGFAKAPLAEQTQQLDTWLSAYPPGTSVYVPREQNPELVRATWSLSAVEQVTLKGDREGEGPRERQIVTIGDHKITLIRPAGFVDTDKVKVPPTEMVAQALAGLPPALCVLIKSVELHEHDNPNDAQFAKIYKKEGFKSQFTASSSGEINGYPSESKWRLSSLDGYMAHEVGHIFSFKVLGTNYAGAGWADVRTAIAADRFAPSGYSHYSEGEFFSESLEAYLDVKDTPEAADLNAMFPDFILKLETYLGIRGPR